MTEQSTRSRSVEVSRWPPGPSFDSIGDGLFKLERILTFSPGKRNEIYGVWFWRRFSGLIGKPVKVRHGPATVIAEDWPARH